MDRLPGRDGFHLKTKNVHAIVRHNAASQTLLRELMMHRSVNLCLLIQRGVNEEGQSKIVGVGIHLLLIVLNIARALKLSLTEIILEFDFYIC